MTATLICMALSAAVLGFAGAALYAGSRAGDRPGDAALRDISADASGAGISFTLTNRGPHTVLVGASLEQRSIRLRCEGGYFVSVPTRTWRRHFLAGRHAVVCAVAAGDTETVLVPVGAETPRRAELVVAVGEFDRLRVVHRAVECGGLGPATAPHAVSLPLTQPS